MQVTATTNPGIPTQRLQPVRKPILIAAFFCFSMQQVHSKRDFAMPMGMAALLYILLHGVTIRI